MGLVYEFDEVEYSLNDGVYPVEEDSLLLIRSAKKILKPGMNVLDMGCGNGLLSLVSKTIGCNTISVDREPKSLILTRKNLEMNGFQGDLFISDLYEGLPHGYHDWADLITFNPPYLPYDGAPIERRVDLPLIGGKKGYEVARSFLEGSLEYLKENGRILLLVYPEWSILDLSPQGKYHMDKPTDSDDMNGEVLNSILLSKRP